MKKLTGFIIAFFFLQTIAAQELYNLTEPASTLPKGALGIRLFDESYDESGLIRKITEVKVMYGLTPKLTLILSGVAADFHSLYLPVDFIQHDHSGGGAPPGAYKPAVIPYPYIFAGCDLYAQYRFFSSDGENSHFRMAAYGEGSYVRIASHLAEAELLTHNSGVGAGLITTYLKSHFAASVTAGFTMPFEYNGNSIDKYGGIYPTTIIYGNAFNYDLALGYLLFPQHYKSYKQTNLNIYLEFLGRSYGAADVTQRDGTIIDHIPNNISFLKAGDYVDIDPGLQCIIRSDVRIDFSVGFPLINSSYLHTYPLYYIGLQRYFYFKKHASEKND
jgi:hypothetical protein